MANDGTPYTPGWNPQITPQQSQGAVPGMIDPTAAANAETMRGLQQSAAFMQEAMRRAQQPQVAMAPAPAVPGYQPESTTPPAGMFQSRAWGPERMMYTAGATAGNLIQAYERKKQQRLVNQYNDYLETTQKYAAMPGMTDPNTGNLTPQGVDAVQKELEGRGIGEKELRQIGKTAGEPWMNPKKQGADAQALNTAVQQTQQKQQARNKLTAMFSHLVRRNQQPQFSPQQQQQLSEQRMRDIISKTPMMPRALTPQDAAGYAKTYMDMAVAQKDFRENYAVTTDWSTGRQLAYNKNNPKDWFYLSTTDASGKTSFVGAKPQAQEGKIITNPEKIPVAVVHNGVTVYPGSDEFNALPPEEQANIQGKLNIAEQEHAQGQAERLFLKAPELAGEAGPIPIPPIGPDGLPDRSNPKYIADFKSWGENYRKLKVQEAGDRAELQRKASFDWRTSAYADPNDPGTIHMGFNKDIMQHGWQLPASAESQAAIASLQYFTSQAGATQFTAFRTTLDHADTLMEAAKYLETGDERTWNLWKNKWKTETGSPTVTNFEIVAATFNREVQRTLDAGHITEGEIREQDLRLPSNASPDQIYGAVDRLKSLLTSKGLELARQAEAGKKGQIAYPPGIGPQTPPAAPKGITPKAPPAGTSRFTDAGTTYNIPKDQIAAFKKAHPNATPAAQ